eukprot:GGOE01002426.1.p1 GENE.GGOE01002426.1~~GGOE01002426.1.p1  ORF type:complete len:624 (+),score=181.45 GGOE01002426.1:132-2003(+)
MQPTLRRYGGDEEAIPIDFTSPPLPRRAKRSSRASLMLAAVSVSFLVVWVLYVTRHLSSEPELPDPKLLDRDNAVDLAARIAGHAVPPDADPLLALNVPTLPSPLPPFPASPASHVLHAADAAPAAPAVPQSPEEAPPAASPMPPVAVLSGAQMAVQRAAYLFFQAVGYQLLLNNVQAHRLHSVDVKPLVQSYAALHTTIIPGVPCPDLQRVVDQLLGPAAPSEEWWTGVFPAVSLSAFTCGMAGQLSTGTRTQVPLDISTAGPGFQSAEVLWLTADLPLSTEGMLSEVVPLLSYLVHTNFSASRIVRTPSLFTLATRLWLALFIALVDAVGTAGDAAKAQAFDHFHLLFTTYARMFPCGNCDTQFVAIFRRFLNAKGQLFAPQFISQLQHIMMGHSNPAEYDPACNVSWVNRRTRPDPSNTGPIDPKLFLLPPAVPSPKRRLTVALDIDETLLSVRNKPLLYRPFLTEFLDGLRDVNCEVVIWTASDKPWGTYVVSLIDPKQLIPHRIYRDPSWWKPHPDVYTKDLRRLGRNMADVFILENSPYSAWMNKMNAILIPDFYKANPSDTALQLVLHVVREVLRTGLSVPDFLRTSPLFNRKCPAQMWAPLDEAQPFYGIGDFTP